jgi:subfamily B ATP-binding cassette protein MsbA
LILPIIAVLVSFAGKKFKKYSKRLQLAMGDMTHITHESLSNHKVVRSFSAQEYERERFQKVTLYSQLQQLKIIVTQAIYTPLMQVVIYCSMAFVMFLVLYFQGDASMGELISYINLTSVLPKPVRQLSEINSSITRGLVGANSIFSQLDEPVEMDNGTIEREVQGKIDFQNVSFKYQNTDELVLKNVSMSIKAGTTVALVGASGSGKTTLTSLIPRFYDIEEGQILIDDINIKDYSLKSLRDNISVVSQQINLFNDTAYNNIAYGPLALCDEQLVYQAAKMAFVDEFILSLPNGYQTLVGENGTLLSGGQRQRIFLARAFLKNSPILILDEATSALDNQSEHYIQEALKAIVKNKTTIIIAHRLSTIENADVIYLLDKGEIVEFGNHQELLAKKGAYYQLHSTKLQDG